MATRTTTVTTVETITTRDPERSLTPILSEITTVIVTVEEVGTDTWPVATLDRDAQTSARYCAEFAEC